MTPAFSPLAEGGQGRCRGRTAVATLTHGVSTKCEKRESQPLFTCHRLGVPSRMLKTSYSQNTAATPGATGAFIYVVRSLCDPVEKLTWRRELGCRPVAAIV